MGKTQGVNRAVKPNKNATIKIVQSPFLSCFLFCSRAVSDSSEAALTVSFSTSLVSNKVSTTTVSSTISVDSSDTLMLSVFLVVTTDSVFWGAGISKTKST